MKKDFYKTKKLIEKITKLENHGFIKYRKILFYLLKYRTIDDLFECKKLFEKSIGVTSDNDIYYTCNLCNICDYNTLQGCDYIFELSLIEGKEDDVIVDMTLDFIIREFQDRIKICNIKSRIEISEEKRKLKIQK
jgi:hypothetical protein